MMKMYPGILYDYYWKLRRFLNIGIVGQKKFLSKSFIELHPEINVSFNLDEEVLIKDPLNQIATYSGRSYTLSRVGYKVVSNANLIGDAAIVVDSRGKVFLQSCLLDIYLLKSSGTISVSFPFIKRKKQKLKHAISIVNLYNIGNSLNYFHWVNDSILALESWQHFKNVNKIEPYVIVPKNLPKKQRDFFMQIGIPESKILPWEGKRIFVENLLLHSTNRTNQKPMDILHQGPYKWLKSIMISGQHQTGSRKVFISRQKSKGRRFINDSEYTHWIQNHKFEEVFLEELPILKQLKIFSESKVIIGAHGAGFTNIFMCKPQTVIIEIFGKPPTFYTDYYRLANQLELKYHLEVFDYRDQPNQNNRKYKEIDLIFDSKKLDLINFPE